MARAVPFVWILLLVCASPASAQNVACLDCHEVDVESIESSVHLFLECLDCHPQASNESHIETGAGWQCSTCHEQEVFDFQQSVHGEAEAAGIAFERGCSSCHHQIHTLKACGEPGCFTNPTEIAETCGTCHADPDLAHQMGIRLVQPIAAYTESIHARSLAAGEDGASCDSCHGTHAIFASSDSRSTVNYQKVPSTCAPCHEEITAAYEESVHGRAVAHGIEEAPVCTDCHGEHRILEPQRADSPVFPSNIPKQTCGRCHGDLEMSRKFGMAPDKVPAYEDSYHGLASRSGQVSVANCASCHGVHDILPSTDPGAHTNPENLSETCGQCHPGAGERFAIGPVHVLPDQPEHAAVYWIRKIYLWLIYLVIGGMIIHNLWDFIRKVRNPLPRPTVDQAPGHVRMPLAGRWVHALLLSSFIVLVYTGFALKYPEAWWSCPFPFWEGSCELRGWIHRGAALVMTAAAIIHLVHAMIDRYARRVIAEMVPNRRDLKDLVGRIEYFVGKREHPPKVGWMSYPEKMEYLGVVWGTLVMAVTGFLLWFETPVLRWFPSWVLDVATVVHLYEAILATLSILVWHFYAVIFDPMVYPMDTAWINGRSTPARELEREDPPIIQENEAKRPDPFDRA